MNSIRFPKLLTVLLVVAVVSGLSLAQETPKPRKDMVNPVAQFTKGMVDRLSQNLHVKKIVGDPVKIGKVTIVPIIMLDVSFYGGGGGAPQMGGHGFGMGGEAKPLGFVVFSKAGVKFIPVGKIPRK